MKHCADPYWIEIEDAHIPARCGKCIFCLIHKRQTWSYRLNVEHRHAIGSAFVTLTYAEQPQYGCLVKSDFQKYMKRLRKKCSTRLRYYAVGEYGTLRSRPHYHVLLFNINQKELEYARTQWKAGLVHIGRISQASITYCLKYVVQPEQKTNKIVKPFSLMSRSFGMGGQYLSQDMVDWHQKTKTTYCRLFDKKVAMPKFYRERIFYGIQKEETRKTIIQETEKEKIRQECEWIRAGIDPETHRRGVRAHIVNTLKTKIQYTEKL